MQYQARCVYTGWIAGTYSSQQRAKSECDHLNRGIKAGARFVVVVK